MLTVPKHELVERAPAKHRESIIGCLMKNQAVNPHQAKICGYFWIENPNYPYSGANSPEGVLPWKLQNEAVDFLNTTYANDREATLYRHEAILMERGISDLGNKIYRDKNFNSTLENLMFLLCHYSFERAGIIISDDKPRNYIFVETEGQLYCGNLMDQYDFWCYKLEETSIYIPTPPIFIKRIDYSEFRVNISIVDNSSKNLQYIVETYPEGKYEWLSYRAPKDPNARILEISL